MKQANCPQEASVSKAVRTGEWEESLTAHVTECALCREIVQASRWMQALARSSQVNLNLPDASLVWWKARFSEKQEKMEKAQRALEWMEIAFAAIISLSLGGLLVWNWFAIQQSVAGLWQSTWLQIWIAAFSMENSTPVFFSSAIIVVSLIAIFLAYPLFTEE